MNKLKRLTKCGDNYAVILDKSILDLVDINDRTSLQIKISIGNESFIVIKPCKDSQSNELLSD